MDGAKNVDALRDTVLNWMGDPDQSGPLLLISHFTNIEELTQFAVFEGEILVLDPKRDNQVIGSIRLASAAPDEGHFSTTLESPLLYEERSLDMVGRYYNALNDGNAVQLEKLLSDDWVGRVESPIANDQSLDAFLKELDEYRAALSNGKFQVNDVHVSDDVVTVLGTITGQHTGDLFGLPPTGRQVSFGSIAVHRILNGAIVESWQMVDRRGSKEQIL